MFCEWQTQSVPKMQLVEPIERLVTIAGWICVSPPYKSITITLYRAKTFCDQKDDKGKVIGKKRVTYLTSKKIEICPDGRYRIVGLVRQKYSVRYSVQICLDGQPQKPRTIVVLGFAPRYRWKPRKYNLFV